MATKSAVHPTWLPRVQYIPHDYTKSEGHPTPPSNVPPYLLCRTPAQAISFLRIAQCVETKSCVHAGVAPC